jgi:hypothetical protein
MRRIYIKRHAVVKDGKRYVYLRLVEAYRDDSGGVRHRVLRTLGREDELKASGQLEQLAASFARLDPPPAGTRRYVGPLLPVHHYLRRLELIGLVDRAAPMRGRAMLTHGSNSISRGASPGSDSSHSRPCPSETTTMRLPVGAA